MKLQAYPRAKPSGVEWLGDVPERWDVKRLSYLATLKSGENITSEMIAEGGDYPVYGGNGLRGNYHKFTHRGHHALIGRQGALCGNINYASGEFYASEHALVVSPLKEFVVVWMGELLRAMNLGQYSVTAAQPGIAAEMIRGLRIPVPPLAEQRAIATFLDRVTGRVDRLVAKKRELIERLKEKRTALISRTVTRGLPAEAAAKAGLRVNPPLKPSGLDWLGDIPQHWEVCKLKRVTISRCDGPFGSGLKSEHYTDEGVRVIRLQNIRFAQFDDSDAAFIEPEYYSELGDHSVLPGDLLIAGLGDENHPVGRACVAPSDLGAAMVKADCFRFRLHPKRAAPAYLALQLSTTAGALAGALATGTTRGRMNLSATESREVALPPLPEQTAIAAYLDKETAKLDALVGKVEEAVERLQEYRTALITAVVTGKIDVRKHVNH